MSVCPALLQVVITRWFNAEADYALRQGMGLAKRGWPVVVLAADGTPIQRRALEEGLSVESIPDPSANSPVALAKAAVLIRRAVRRHGIRVVNFHRSEGTVAMAAALGRMAGRPLLVRTRGDVRRIRRTPLNRTAWRRCFDLIVASGSGIAREVESDLGLAPGTVRVIPYGVDTELFSPDGAPRGVPVVGYVGRLGPVKGVAHLLDAAELLAAQGHRFTLSVLVKDPSEYPAEHQAIAGRIAAPPLLGIATLKGHVASLPKELRGWSVGVVPSVGSEANCRTAQELMACGVPVVASSVGSLPEVVEDKVTGRVVPPADPRALAEAIGGLLRDGAAREAAGAAARQRMVARYSLDGMTEASERLFLGGLEGR